MRALALLALLVAACGGQSDAGDELEPCPVVEGAFVHVFENAERDVCIVFTARPGTRLRLAGDDGPGALELVAIEGETVQVLSCLEPRPRAILPDGVPCPEQ